MRSFFYQILLIFIGIVLSVSSALIAQEPGFDVKITPSDSKVSIKDTLTVTLDINFPEDYQVNRAALQKNVLRNSSFYGHPFSVKDVKIDAPKKNARGGISQQITFILQPLRLGEVFLTFYDIPFIASDNQSKTYKIISPIFPIQVLAVEAPMQFQDHLAPLLTFDKSFPLELDAQNTMNFIEDPEVLKLEITSMNSKCMKNVFPGLNY